MKLVSQIICLSVALACCSCNSPSSESGTNSPINAAPAIAAGAVKVIQPQAAPDTIKGSIKAEAKGRLEQANVVVRYHSPAVRGRQIWGGLVTMDQVWVAGAHMATSIEFNVPLTFGGTKVPAGKYALFLIPSTQSWTIILNRNWQQHLTDEYDVKDDIVRYIVQPQITPVSQERLMYQIENGHLVFQWADRKVQIR